MKATLQLDLFEDVVTLPWHGKSPRTLTESRKALFLRRKPQRTPDDFDPAQLDLFRTVVKKAPWKYQGAPLLIQSRS